MLVWLWFLLASTSLLAQTGLGKTGCATVAAWSPCDLTFELTPQENPTQAQLRAEFRSPRHKTYLLRAFPEGRKLIIRFTPTEAGAWITA